MLCVFTRCQRDRQALLGMGATTGTGKRHFKELFIQRVIYSPEILRGCLLDHAGEWKLLKSRMPQVQVGQAADLSLWAAGSLSSAIITICSHPTHDSSVAVTFGTEIIYVMETTHAGIVILPHFLIHQFLNEFGKSKGKEKENDQC